MNVLSATISYCLLVLASLCCEYQLEDGSTHCRGYTGTGLVLCKILQYCRTIVMMNDDYCFSIQQ